MAVTLRSDWSAQVLINYITAEVRTLEPELQLANLGVKRDVPKGFNVLAFPQTNQIATTSVSTVSEGIDPVAVTWGSTAYTSTATQYGKLCRIKTIFNFVLNQFQLATAPL